MSITLSQTSLTQIHPPKCCLGTNILFKSTECVLQYNQFLLWDSNFVIYMHTHTHTHTHMPWIIQVIDLICTLSPLLPFPSGNAIVGNCSTNIPYITVSCSFDDGPLESCKFKVHY